MAKSILIDNNNLEVLKVVSSVRKAEYWADILIPYNDFLIVGTAKKDLSAYTPLELARLYHHLTGEHPPEDIEYSKLLTGVHVEMQRIGEDETPIKDLKKQLRNQDPAVPEIGVKGDEETEETFESPDRPEPPKTPRRPSGTVKPLKRPKEGSATGKVWDIADSLVTEGSEAPTRQQVVEACEEQGLNKSTASTQYGKWKKYFEVVGSN